MHTEREIDSITNTECRESLMYRRNSYMAIVSADVKFLILVQLGGTVFVLDIKMFWQFVSRIKADVYNRGEAFE